MELRKELPEVFEEFAEARKNSFLAIKKIKDAGTPIVGVFCTYLPREIANAMDGSVATIPVEQAGGRGRVAVKLKPYESAGYILHS